MRAGGCSSIKLILWLYLHFWAPVQGPKYLRDFLLSPSVTLSSRFPPELVINYGDRRDEVQALLMGDLPMFQRQHFGALLMASLRFTFYPPPSPRFLTRAWQRGRQQRSGDLWDLGCPRLHPSQGGGLFVDVCLARPRCCLIFPLPALVFSFPPSPDQHQPRLPFAPGARLRLSALGSCWPHPRLGKEPLASPHPGSALPWGLGRGGFGRSRSKESTSAASAASSSACSCPQDSPGTGCQHCPGAPRPCFATVWCPPAAGPSRQPQERNMSPASVGKGQQGQRGCLLLPPRQHSAQHVWRGGNEQDKR